jgi:hypothetical protein
VPIVPGEEGGTQRRRLVFGTHPRKLEVLQFPGQAKTVTMQRRHGPKRLADMIPAAIGQAAAERGFAAVELLSRWTEIAGPELGPRCRPVRFAWPPRGRASDPTAAPVGAVLHLRVESGFALNLQYESEALIARINAYLGWRCVEQIRLKQGPVGAPGKGARAQPPLPAAARAALDDRLAAVDADLAGPLRRLGEAVLARSGARS